jgi:hypothetical protein
MVPADGIHQGRVADFFSAQLGDIVDRKIRHQPIVGRVRRRSETNDRLTALHQQIRGNVITRDEIDVAPEQGLFCGFRAVAKFEADFEPVLLPNSRFVHHLPDRQMRMGTEQPAYVDDFIFGHISFSLHLVPRPLAGEGEGEASKRRFALILTCSRWDKECLVYLLLSAFSCSLCLPFASFAPSW